MDEKVDLESYILLRGDSAAFSSTSPNVFDCTEHSVDGKSAGDNSCRFSVQISQNAKEMEPFPFGNEHNKDLSLS